jgi:tryptophanyl-tRNA synthetase
MSKSDPNPLSYISLSDPEDEIARKIRRAVTDSGREIVYDEEHKPALANLLTIYSSCTGDAIPEIECCYAGKGYAEFKDDLTEAVIATVVPIQRRFNATRESGRVREILAAGARKANSVAAPTLSLVKEKLGLSMLIDPVKRTI